MFFVAASRDVSQNIPQTWEKTFQVMALFVRFLFACMSMETVMVVGNYTDSFFPLTSGQVMVGKTTANVTALSSIHCSFRLSLIRVFAPK